jgi:hypothetical protein
LKAILHLAWERFSLLTSIIGEVQGHVIAVGFYFTILLPFGLISHLFSDPLNLDAPPSSDNSFWLERPTVPDDLDSAQQQG